MGWVRKDCSIEMFGTVLYEIKKEKEKESEQFEMFDISFGRFQIL